ncbi:cysteine--tRNA ligase [Candidatus Woesearchaeota archaeon]|nr:cysteine--tRNA ligase [Candidatus Woesearchaeota archaeon]
MTLKLFNTQGRTLGEFRPIKKGEVGLYSCGPTVYWYQHIGNLRTYIFNDILKRVLTYDGFKVKHVMNVTDVGHLTSDADEGEDKMEKAAAKEGKKAEDIANFYLSVFREDFKKLNITEPTVWCKATEHIKEQIELIQKLEKKGFTYKTEDGIYFDTSKFEDYGKLALLNIEGLESGKRIDAGEKKNKTDFALWKFSNKDEKRQQEWKSPWGTGFPGWHIECSAMSSKYLGEQFDIHTGGEDHIPVHHTNEIAQSECAFGKKPWVKYWLHGAFLTFKGDKISKSKGGLYTISELEKLGYEPLAYRYLCLLTHYRKPLDFSLESLDAARTAYDRLKAKIIDMKKDEFSRKTPTEFKQQFMRAIDEDLNMPKAIGILWDVLNDDLLGNKQKLELCYDFDKVFGLGLKDVKEEKVDVPKEVKELVDKRNEAKKKKDFALADKLRNEIKAKGYGLLDSKEGTKVKKI